MLERLIGMAVCLLCAFPFLVLGVYGKDSLEPVTFWTGDKSLKEKVKDLKGYNKEMSKLYKIYALAFVIVGIGWLIHPILGVILMILNLTVGIYFIFKKYKEILGRYS